MPRAPILTGEALAEVIATPEAATFQRSDVEFHDDGSGQLPGWTGDEPVKELSGRRW